VVFDPNSINEAVTDVKFFPEPKNVPLTYDAPVKSILADPETLRDDDISTISKLAVFSSYESDIYHIYHNSIFIICYK